MASQVTTAAPPSNLTNLEHLRFELQDLIRFGALRLRWGDLLERVSETARRYSAARDNASKFDEAAAKAVYGGYVHKRANRGELSARELDELTAAMDRLGYSPRRLADDLRDEIQRQTRLRASRLFGSTRIIGGDFATKYRT